MASGHALSGLVHGCATYPGVPPVRGVGQGPLCGRRARRVRPQAAAPGPLEGAPCGPASWETASTELPLPCSGRAIHLKREHATRAPRHENLQGAFCWPHGGRHSSGFTGNLPNEGCGSRGRQTAGRGPTFDTL